MDLIVTVVVVLAIFTMVYKWIPYSELMETKPSLALLPKYKTEVTLAGDLADAVALEKKLASYGFKKASEKDGKTYFVRGHILGDFSIKLAKIRLGFKSLPNSRSEITLEASWFMAFDTGDCWTFLAELSQKLQRNIV